MPRVHEIIMPAIRAQFPDAMVTSWVPDIDAREYPLINIRRLGGLSKNPDLLDKPVVEITVYHDKSLPEAEDLYYDVREFLFYMVDRQIVTPAGYLHSYFETMGPTQFPSKFDASFRIQGLIQLGVRPPRAT
jgi:hypothetical protein